MLRTDQRPVPFCLERDTYIGFLDIVSVNERDVRVPLPFPDSGFDFGAPVGGDHIGRAEVPKCELVTRIVDWLRSFGCQWKADFPQKIANRSDLEWVAAETQRSDIGYINDLGGLRRVGCRRHFGEKCIERIGFKVGFRMLINEEAESEYKY